MTLFKQGFKSRFLPPRKHWIFITYSVLAVTQIEILNLHRSLLALQRLSEPQCGHADRPLHWRTGYDAMRFGTNMGVTSFVTGCLS